MTDCFASSLDHLMAELKRIELRLRGLVSEARRDNRRTADERFAGLYVSDQQIDAILSGAPAPAPERPADEALQELEASIARSAAESQRRGVRLRLVELAGRFGLSPFDIDTVLVCVLPELDLKYQRLYGYLQDDITRKSPTVDLVLRLLAGSPAGAFAAP